MSRPLRIGITTGDQDGVGPEVTVKALQKLGVQKKAQFFVWRNQDFPAKEMRKLHREFKVRTVNSWAEALRNVPESAKELVDIATRTNPATWVEESGTACHFGHLDAIATAPLSKPLIQLAGMKDIGHTDILKRISNTRSAYMTFVGKHFNVFVGSGHLPLSQVPLYITADRLEEALLQCHEFDISALNPKLKAPKPIGVLGLNPHAGDSGLIGKEEMDIIIPVIEKLNKKMKGRFVGPLVPDAAFTEKSRTNYGTFFAMYHDQGLIPFKAIHGQDGVHITWGLPFIRTSVDHGTAKDIAGLDKADSTSMRLAIEWAIRLARSKKGAKLL